MKKRLLALCLVLCMVLGMLPVTAFAATGAYVKATSIAVGDTVALVCDEAAKELSGISTTSTKYGLGVDFPGNPTGVVAFTVVQGASEGTFAFQNGSNYLYWGSGNSLNFAADLSANTSWTVSFDADGNAILVNSANDEARQIAWNVSSPRFANYKDSTLSGDKGFSNNSYYHVQLYKWDASASTCQHTNTSTTTVDATCTEAGSVTVTCDDCGATISTTELAATGHNYVDGVCACGEKEPTAPTTGDGILELTAEILELGAYAAGTKTVEGVGIEWIELGSYGNGIQMRIKNGNTATLFNTLALPGEITKIELTYNSAKSTYDNADAFTFSFGNAQDNLTATTNLSTVSGVKTYTVTPPAGSYTFFKMQLNLTYSYYWDSINVYYNVAGSETETPACEHTKTTTTTVEATCTAAGSTTVTCDDCGETLSTEELPVADHTWTDATTEAPKTCTVCGATEGEKLGTEANPIPVTFTMNEEYTEGTATVTVPAGTTYYYQAFGIGGMELTINDGEATLMAGNPRMPVVFSVTNDGEEAAEFVLTVTYPVGSQMNPVELQMGYNYATIEAGNNQGYYYTWTAPVDGTLTLAFSAEDADWNPCGWMYTVNNMTSGAYGDTQWSDSDPVVNPAVVTVKAGDEIQLIVNAYDPADPWNTPAADVITEASFVCDVHGDGKYEDNYDNATHDYVCTVCGAAVVDDEEHAYTDGQCVCGAYAPGTEQNPIVLTELENTVENSGTVYYQCYFSGTHMSINSNDGEYKVTIDGTTEDSWWGMYDADVVTPNPRMPFNFSIEGEGTLQINFEYPEGSMENPADLYIGYNYAAIEAGNDRGYFYNWTAPADGTLTLTFSATDSDWAECGWFYVVNNTTSSAYGDMQWSDSDPVVNPAVVTVKAGDKIELIVNTYDPANMWSNPAGEVETIARFECDEHANLVMAPNDDQATHSISCNDCGTTLVEAEDHEYVDGLCACGATVPGTESNPIMVEWTWNDDQTEGTAVVTVPAGTTLYFGTPRFDDQNELTVDGQLTDVTPGNPWFGVPASWPITNSGNEDAEYELKISFKKGTYNNPDELVMGDNVSEHDGTLQHYYTWTAPMDGTLVLNMAAEAPGWFCVVNNMTTYIYGDPHYSDSDPLVNPIEIEVLAGEELMIEVNTYDPENPYLAPAGVVTVTASFEEKGVGFAGMTMSLGNSLAVNFVIDTALLEGDGHVAVITKTYADGTEPMSVRIPQADWAVYSGTMRYFTFTGVKAKEMTDEFTVVIYNAAGEKVSKTYTRTIAEYCVGQIERYEQAANPDAERLALYVDILKYGAAAQNYFSYNVNNLATANLSAAQLAYGTQNAEVTDIRVKGTGYLGSTLLLQNEILLNFVFANATADKAAYAMVTYDHYDGTSGTVKIMAADFQAYGTTGKYVTVPGLKMADYQQVVTLTLHDANGNVLSTSQDSVASYVARMSDADPVYDAVVKLGKSSLAYFK